VTLPFVAAVGFAEESRIENTVDWGGDNRGTAMTIVRSAACRRVFALRRAFPAATLLLVLTQASQCHAAADVVNNNTTPIVMNVDAATTPYPSVINVSGISGNVTSKVQVILRNFGHIFPDDVDILLEAPDGTRSIVMSDSGAGVSVSGEYLTFSPTATSPVPDESAISDALPLRPTNGTSVDDVNSLSDVFPAPGPGTLVRAVADFDAFNGINPNGAWKLYVVDDYPSLDGGAILEGWSLVLTVPTMYTVTKVADTNDGTCDSDCSLREAIAAAGDGDLIRFGSPLFDGSQTITLDGTELSISKSVTIEGPGADRLSISGNFASRVFNVASATAVTLKGMTIRDGNADVGGGMLSTGQLTLTDVAFSGNKANGDGQSPGGALYLGANGNITGSTFSDNLGGQGGAIFFANSDTLRLANTTISGNRANYGGGIFLLSANGSDVRLDVIGSTLANNGVPPGGDGAGIDVVTQNSAESSATVTLRNTIIANNVGSNINALAASGTISIASLGFNLTNDATSPYLIAPSDIRGVDPRLGPLNNNGGHVETHPLLGGSPALDTGHSSGYPKDQRGVSRLFDAQVGGALHGSDYSDIGAAEMHALLVSNTDDSGAGSLRIAMGIANINGAGQDDILFDPNVFGATPQTINLAGALPEINTSLTINGPGAKLLTVRRDTGGDYGVFNAPNGGFELALSGMTISNGLTSGFGGGLYSVSRTSVAQVAFTGNDAAAGGGLSLVNADGTVKDSTFSGNAADSAGGGIYFQANNHSLRVIDTTLSGNSAVLGGGGIENASQDGTQSLVEIVNSTVADNDAPSGGGVEAFTQVASGSAAAITLRNSIVANNTLPNLATLSICDGCSPTIVSLGYNLTDDPTPVYLDQPTDWIDTDPMLRPLADNGGPTKTHALKPGSPALDAGDRSGSNTDQRGYQRPYDQSGPTNVSDGSDIGAFEQDDTLFSDGFDG